MLGEDRALTLDEVCATVAPCPGTSRPRLPSPGRRPYDRATVSQTLIVLAVPVC